LTGLIDVSNWRTALREEETIVVDRAGTSKPLTQSELAIQHADRSRTHLKDPILARLRHVFVDSLHTRLCHAQRAARAIEVRDC
jgi:hypothetical protein